MAQLLSQVTVQEGLMYNRDLNGRSSELSDGKCVICAHVYIVVYSRVMAHATC